MAYTHSTHIANGLTLDFTVQAADTAADNILGINSSGEVTEFTSIPASRISAGGTLSEATSSVLTISASGKLLGNATIQVKQASGSQAGYLSSADWTTFNGKLGSSLTSAFILVGNGSNVASPIGMTGDISITNGGVTAIGAGKIVNAQINASAAIAHSKMAALSASLVMATDGSGFATTIAGFTPTIAGYLTGITSAVQSQIDSKLSVTLTGPVAGDVITYDGASWVNGASGTGVPVGGAANQFLTKIDGTNYNTQWTTLALSYVTDVTASAAEVNLLDGVTTTTSQFNYLNSATSNIQTQIDNKLTNSLAQNSIWIGNASNQATVLGPGTNGYVLTSSAGVPTWAAIVGTGTVTSIDVSGGTTGLTYSGGPVTTTGTITMVGTLIAANGGTGFASYTVGDILYANTTTTLAKLAAGTVNYVLTSGGAGVAPSWAVAGTGNISGTLTSGRISFASGANTLSDDSDLTFNTAGNILTLTSGKFSSGVTNMVFDVNSITALTISTAGLFTFNSNAGGGGTSNFLRADGTWAAPTGTGIGGSISSTQVAIGSGSNTISGSANFVYGSGIMTISGNAQGRLELLGNSTTASYIRIYSNSASNGQMYLGQDDSTGATFSGISYAQVLFMSGTSPFLIYTNSAERLRIDSAGLISIPSGQIKFPATANPSSDVNVLDDYEEGTWTPAATFQAGSSWTYSVQSGSYVKIGKVVYIWGKLTFSSLGSATGNFTITGLPFTCENVANINGGITITAYAGMSLTSPGSLQGGIIAPNTATILPQGQSTSATPQLDASKMSSTSSVTFFGHYNAA